MGGSAERWMGSSWYDPGAHSADYNGFSVEKRERDTELRKLQLENGFCHNAALDGTKIIYFCARISFNYMYNIKHIY